MRTLVLQSYRTSGVPAWISRCLSSVHDWTAEHGHSYLRIGDELFAVLPRAIVARTADAKVAQTDLARALWMRDLLKTWERVVWVDADVYILDRLGFRLDDADAFTLCFECWPYQTSAGIAFNTHVNNGVFSFTRGQRFLADYIDLASDILMSADPVVPHSVGTPVFSALYNDTPFALRRDVLMFNALLLDEILKGESKVLQEVRQRHRVPIKAVHLVHSFTEAGAVERVSEARVAQGLDLVIEQWEAERARSTGSSEASVVAGSAAP